jgi:flagellin-like protein
VFEYISFKRCLILIDKRGISPLIATVLLIGFTIVLAALVFQWGGGFFKDIMGSTDITTKAKTDAISKISISTPTIVYSNNQITKLIVNNEDLTYSLDGFDVQREWNDGSIETKTIMFPLGPGQGADITNNGANPINFSIKTTGILKSIRVIPIFTVTSDGKSIQVKADEKINIVQSGDPRITTPPPTPATCHGTPNSCASYGTMKSSCLSAGCNWCDPAEHLPGFVCDEDYCSGSPIICESFTDSISCGSHNGCTWS